MVYAIIAIVVVLLLGGGYYFYSKSYKPSTSNTTNTTSTQSVSTNTVKIVEFAFTPEVIKISKGTTVTWTNNGNLIHRIASNSFNSNNLSSGDTYSFTFNETGTFDYHCAIHTSMRGQVIVE